MSPKQILIVAIRLTVIIWIVKTLSTAIPLMDFASDNDIRFPVSEVLGVFGFYSIVWLFLWFFLATTANFLLPKIHQKPQELPKNPAPWLTTGLILIGFYSLSLALADLTYLYSFYQIAQNGITASADGIWTMMTNQDKATTLAATVQTLIGILLIFGAPFISRQIRKHL